MTELHILHKPDIGLTIKYCQKTKTVLQARLRIAIHIQKKQCNEKQRIKQKQNKQKTHTPTMLLPRTEPFIMLI